MVFCMATALQPNSSTDELVEANLSFDGELREANGEAGSRKVILDLIVEGFGNAADGHYYSQSLLERVAHRFEGAKMFSDHLTREAEQKLGGLPRTWRDMVGRINRVWTDVNEAGKRVIRGEAQIFDDQLWRLLEQAIDVVGVSINARGTAAPGTVEGRSARVVEDITKVKSVDVVAEAGAGGRILALVEAAVEEAIQEGAQMSARDQASIDAELERDLAEGDTDAPDEQPDADDEGATATPPAADDADDANDEDDADSDGEPANATQEIAREAARTVLQEMGLRPGEPIRRLSAPSGGPSWNDGTGYVEYGDDEFWRSGDPIDTRRPRAGRSAHIVLEGDDDDVLEGDDDDVLNLADDDDDDVPGLPEDDDAVEAQIEARARELAGQRLYEAVREAMTVVRDEYERRHQESLAEAQRGFDRKLAQRDQRHMAAGLIEAARLPRTSEQALKAEFYDAFFEGGESALREAVGDAVSAKQRELGTFASTRRTDSGDTVAMHEADLAHRGATTKAPARAGIDDGIERELS